MHPRYKTLANQAVRMFTAGFNEPQLLFSPRHYATMRDGVLKDPAPFVAPAIDPIEINLRTYRLGMWIRSYGEAGASVNFQRVAGEWLTKWRSWYGEYASGTFQRLGAAMQCGAVSFSLEPPSIPGIHEAAVSDFHLSIRMLLRAYREPWKFSSTDSTEELLAVSAADLKAPPVAVRCEYQLPPIPEWRYRFAVQALNHTKCMTAEYAPPGNIRVCEIQTGDAWWSTNLAAPFGMNGSLLPIWREEVGKAVEKADWFIDGFQNDLVARILAFAETLSAASS